MSEQTTQPKPASDEPKFRYTASVAADIEPKWQEYWAAHHTFEVPDCPADTMEPKAYILDMFPYPSGAGLHVGHPLGYIATDVLRPLQADDRPQRAAHAGLRRLRPARRAVRGRRPARTRGSPPRPTSRATRRRSTGSAWATTRGAVVRDDRPDLLQVDAVDLPADLQLLVRRAGRQGPPDQPADRAVRLPAPAGPRTAAPGPTLSAQEQATIIDAHRLAYIAEAPVNWCPGLGTVLSNEEVTADGRSERGNFPVFKRNLRQWMMRITKYADRLLDDLDRLDWPEPIKLQQRNWIGRSEGARVHFPVTAVDGAEKTIEIFTTRPDTLFGATYMVLAPEHELVDSFVAEEWPAGHPREVDRRARDPGRGRRRLPRGRRGQDRGRAADRGPAEDRRVHRHVRGEPGQRRGRAGVHRRLCADGLRHRRDHGGAGARPARLRVRAGLRPADARSWSRHRRTGRTTSADWTEAYDSRDGAIGQITDSANDEVSLDGLPIPTAKPRDHRLAGRTRGSARAPSPTGCATGCSAGSATGASRSRSSTTSDGPGRIAAARSRCCRWSCRRSTTTRRRPSTPDDANSAPEPPLARAADWVNVTLDLGDGAAAVPPRDQHHAAVGRLLLVLPALPGPGQRRAVRRPRGREVLDGAAGAPRTPAASTCTSAAPSTRCCTCCTRASGTRCCSTWATSPAPSRSASCTTRA